MSLSTRLRSCMNATKPLGSTDPVADAGLDAMMTPCPNCARQPLEDDTGR
jgi:hypothetical protein